MICFVVHKIKVKYKDYPITIFTDPNYAAMSYIQPDNLDGRRCSCHCQYFPHSSCVTSNYVMFGMEICESRSDRK